MLVFWARGKQKQSTGLSLCLVLSWARSWHEAPRHLFASRLMALEGH